MNTTRGDVDYYRQQAAEAREMALKAHTTGARDNWIEIAKRWEHLAEAAARAPKLKTPRQ